MVECLIRIVEDSKSDIQERAVHLKRIPVQGEYVRVEEELYQVKRIVHQADELQTAAILYSVRSVDPTKDSLGLLEWINPAD